MLHLKNASSAEGDDSFEFTLKGDAEEPLAEGTTPHLSTCPINMPSQHSPSTRTIDLSYEYTLSTHPIKTLTSRPL